MLTVLSAPSTTLHVEILVSGPVPSHTVTKLRSGNRAIAIAIAIAKECAACFGPEYHQPPRILLYTLLLKS